jgi:hypothetical protein
MKKQIQNEEKQAYQAGDCSRRQARAAARVFIRGMVVVLFEMEFEME